MRNAWTATRVNPRPAATGCMPRRRPESCGAGRRDAAARAARPALRALACERFGRARATLSQQRTANIAGIAASRPPRRWPSRRSSRATAPGLAERLSVKGRQDDAGDEQHGLVERAWYRQKSERDEASEWSGYATVAGEDLDCPDEAATRSDHRHQSRRRAGADSPPENASKARAFGQSRKPPGFRCRSARRTPHTAFPLRAAFKRNGDCRGSRRRPTARSESASRADERCKDFVTNACGSYRFVENAT
jgi:hypothetical protein